MSELLPRLSSRELSEWAAYFELEPWGETRADWRIARLCALIAEIHRDRKKKATPFEPKDFMPKGEGDEVGWKTMLSKVEAMTRAMGGRDLRG